MGNAPSVFNPINIVKKTVGGIKDAAEAIKDTTEDIAEDIKDTTEDIFDEAERFGHGVIDEIVDTAEDVGDKFIDLGEIVVGETIEIGKHIKNFEKDTKLIKISGDIVGNSLFLVGKYTGQGEISALGKSIDISTEILSNALRGKEGLDLLDGTELGIIVEIGKSSKKLLKIAKPNVKNIIKQSNQDKKLQIITNEVKKNLKESDKIILTLSQQGLIKKVKAQIDIKQIQLNQLKNLLKKCQTCS